MAVHRTQFEIAASDARVWAVLTDFASYGAWNPSLPRISGELREGAKLSLTLGMPGRPNPRVSARIRELRPRRRLTWHGNAGADRLFSGDRVFVIEPLAHDRVRVTHVEDVGGLLAPAFERLMGDAIQRSHDGFNDALRRRAEGLA